MRGSENSGGSSGMLASLPAKNLPWRPWYWFFGKLGDLVKELMIFLATILKALEKKQRSGQKVQHPIYSQIYRREKRVH